MHGIAALKLYIFRIHCGSGDQCHYYKSLFKLLYFFFVHCPKKLRFDLQLGQPYHFYMRSPPSCSKTAVPPSQRLRTIGREQMNRYS